MNIDYTKPLAPQFEEYCKLNPGETKLELFKLDERTDKEIIDTLQAIPLIFSSLYLNKNTLGDLPVDRLIPILKAVPSHVTFIDLRGNKFGKHSAQDLFKIFNALPKKVEGLDLGSNFEKAPEGEALIQLLSAMPELKSLSLRAYRLFELPVDVLIKVFQSLPKTLTTLDLSLNRLQALKTEDLLNVLKALPPLVASLDLGFNAFSLSTANDLLEIFQGLPIQVSTLGFGHNGFEKTNIQNVAMALKHLPEQVKTLFLGNEKGLTLQQNKFESADDLVTLLTAIPSHLRSLQLANSNLAGMKEALTKVFQSLPQQLTTLDLKGNGLQGLSGEVLAEAFAKLPASLTALDLSDNDFSDHPAELIHLLKALPAKLSTLKLNGCLWMNEAHLEEVIKAIPETITDVYIDTPARFLSLTKKQALSRALATKNLHLYVDGTELPAEAPDPALEPPRAEPVRAGFLLLFMSHPAIKVVTSALIVASLAVLLCAGLSVAGLSLSLGLGLAVAATATLGSVLLAGSFFASHRVSQLTLPSEEPPRPPGGP